MNTFKAKSSSLNRQEKTYAEITHAAKAIYRNSYERCILFLADKNDIYSIKGLLEIIRKKAFAIILTLERGALYKRISKHTWLDFLKKIKWYNLANFI